MSSGPTCCPRLLVSATPSLVAPLPFAHQHATRLLHLDLIAWYSARRRGYSPLGVLVKLTCHSSDDAPIITSPSGLLAALTPRLSATPQFRRAASLGRQLSALLTPRHFASSHVLCKETPSLLHGQCCCANEYARQVPRLSASHSVAAVGARISKLVVRRRCARSAPWPLLSSAAAHCRGLFVRYLLPPAPRPLRSPRYGCGRTGHTKRC